jgi:signal peptidase I
MATSIALAREHREFVVPLRRGADGVAGDGPLSMPAGPTIHRFRRQIGEAGPGVAVEVPKEVAPWRLVVRLWVGVTALFLLIVVLGLAGITLGMWAFGYKPVVVTSGSMEPTIHVGDVVVTNHVSPTTKLGVQTIIDFKDPAGPGHHLHRIIEVTPQGYRTKGDANQSADSTIVPRQNVDGTGLVLAPYIGSFAVWVHDGDWPPLVVSGLVLFGAAVVCRRRWMWGTAS